MSSAVRAAPPRPALRTATPTAVWGLCALQLLFALLWSVAVPTFRAPGEPGRVDLARHLAAGETYPDPGGQPLSRQAVSAAQEARFSPEPSATPAPGVRFQIEDVRPRHARPSFAALAEAGRPSGVVNPATQHPPLYHTMAAGLFSLLPETTAYDVQVWLLRALTAVLVAPLPWLVWATGRWLLDDQRAILTAAVFPLAVPMLSHVSGAVADDGLMATLGGLFALGLARMVAGDVRLRTGVLLGVAAGLGMLVKVFALGWLLALPVAVAVAVRGGWVRWSGAVACAGYAAALAAVVGGWWYVRNLGRFGEVQPLVGPFWGAGDGEVAVSSWVVSVLAWLPLRFWGDFGWAEVALPWAVVWPMTAALLVAVGAALAARRPPAIGFRRQAMALLAPLVATLVAVLVAAVRLYVFTDTPAGLHGRHLYGGLAGLAVIVGAGACALAGWRARWLPVGLLGLAVTLQAVSGWLVLRAWWGPPDAGTAVVSLRVMLAWSPLPSVAVAALALLLGVVVLTVGWGLVVQSRTARPAPRALAERRLTAD